MNVFHYLTYEGAVDLDKVDDETQRAAIKVSDLLHVLLPLTQ
jgi:hypothetical protein